MDIYYTVEYAYKKSFFYNKKLGDNYTGTITANVSKEVLCEMLKSLSYLVYSAHVQTGYKIEELKIITNMEDLRKE